MGAPFLDDKKSILIEKIKNVVIEMVHYADEFPKVNFSTYLSEKLGYDYTYLSNLFTEVKGTTIQEFIILHKIEKAKELIIKDNLSYGEWDWEALEGDWNTNLVDKWLGKQTIDYSALDYEDLTEQVVMMTSGVKHAIQIQIDAEHFEIAKELEKECRERKLYIGGNLLRELQNTRRAYENH